LEVLIFFATACLSVCLPCCWLLPVYVLLHVCLPCTGLPPPMDGTPFGPGFPDAKDGSTHLLQFHSPMPLILLLLHDSSN
jgi:hypothetical protein